MMKFQRLPRPVGQGYKLIEYISVARVRLVSRLRSRSLTELTRQIAPPTKNGHAPPPIESRKSSQSVNPYYVWTCALVPQRHGALVPCCHGALVPWCHGALVPRCLSATVPWCRGAVLQCLGAKVPRCHGAMLPWCHDATVPRRHGTTAPWCLCALVPRCHGAMVPRCHAATVPWCLGATVPWWHGAMVPRCVGATMVPRCLGATVPWCHHGRPLYVRRRSSLEASPALHSTVTKTSNCDIPPRTDVVLDASLSTYGALRIAENLQLRCRCFSRKAT
ncbi:hypothetical protein T459_35468 [Capsicum annuum]|uniref:Uncharacterized protein n=1 Tax=Capsicum annuum TaxID=4072 RepID=A0A2G2XJ84_CAPAN|nr:hypothetical protein T459_35468 [Capsicum annuum]